MKLFHTRMFFFLTATLLSVVLRGQGGSYSLFWDVGKTNVSEGFYSKVLSTGSYDFGMHSVSAGIQLDLKSQNPNTFSGTSLKVGRRFSIREQPMQADAFFVLHRFSELLYETNWGVLAETRQKNFRFQLGTGFRAYRYTRDAIDEYNINKNNTLRENFVILYLLGYTLKPDDHHWNLGAAITNIDHFVINQETNPLIMVHGSYRLMPRLSLNMETWYKSAGAFNLSVNYFGFFIRTGLRWDVGR